MDPLNFLRVSDEFLNFNEPSDSSWLDLLNDYFHDEEINQGPEEEMYSPLSDFISSSPSYPQIILSKSHKLTNNKKEKLEVLNFLNIKAKGFQEDFIFERIHRIKTLFFKENPDQCTFILRSPEAIESFRETILIHKKKSAGIAINNCNAFERKILELFLTTQMTTSELTTEIFALFETKKPDRWVVFNEILKVRRKFLVDPLRPFDCEEFKPFIVEARELETCFKDAFDQIAKSFVDKNEWIEIEEVVSSAFPSLPCTAIETPMKPIRLKHLDTPHATTLAFSNIINDLGLKVVGFQRDAVFDKIKTFKCAHFKANPGTSVVEYNTVDEINDFKSKILPKCNKRTKKLDAVDLLDMTILKIILTTRKTENEIAQAIKAVNTSKLGSGVVKEEVAKIRRAYLSPDKPFTSAEFQPFIVESGEIEALYNKASDLIIEKFKNKKGRKR